jgi:hypothetical protein
VREAPDQCDERLIAVRKANPGASIGALAAAIGKSRTSTVNALHRLRDSGLAESRDRVWSLTEPTAPKETPRWIEPVTASRPPARTSARTPERDHAQRPRTGAEAILDNRKGRKAVLVDRI